MRRIKRILTVLCVLACVLLYGQAALDATTGRIFSVELDLSRPESIAWPFEVAIVGDLAEQGLRIGPKVGAGWRGQAGGEATYRFFVPEDGNYTLWAYALWFDKCTNAVFAKVDRHEKTIIGNDPIFQRWHWVRGFSLPLKQGAHTLKLSNHSDHIALQKVVFINSRTALPDHCGLVFSDVFYDGFDGCHIGNFASWDMVSGQWNVKRPEASWRYSDNALIGTSTESAVIVYRAPDWSGYSLDVAVRTDRGHEDAAVAGILFGVQGTDRYHRLQWRPIDDSDKVDMELSRRAGAETEILATFQAVWPAALWHRVEVVLAENAIQVNLDEVGQTEVPVTYDIAGGIGLCVEGASVAAFDEVHVRTVTRTTDGRPNSL